MTNRIKINGVEYPSIKEGCSATGLDQNNLRVLKHYHKGQPFKMKIVKEFQIEFIKKLEKEDDI